MYMEECCSVKKTSDGKFVLMVMPKSKETGKSKGGGMAVEMPEPKSYVANDIEELKELISEHVGGKKNSGHEKSEKEYEKGFKSK